MNLTNVKVPTFAIASGELLNAVELGTTSLSKFINASAGELTALHSLSGLECFATCLPEWEMLFIVCAGCVNVI